MFAVLPLLLVVVFGPYMAEPVQVIDGDTFDAVVYGEWNQRHFVRVRLLGVNAPEVRGKCDREKELAAKASKFLADHLDRVVVLHNVQPKFDAFGRMLADVGDLRGLLLDQPFYAPWGETRDWCSDVGA